ncbi:MAG: hypothetical protein HYX80_10490 [Chloroflexi bacterium]|nr:hypothetical protein [Chloroflexota bacterium]
MVNGMDTERILEEEITASLIEGRLPCPIAFKVARKLDITPKSVGEKTDELGIRIIDCQLGCFGVKKATHDDLKGAPLDANMAGAIQSTQVNGQMPCEAAWEIARQFKVSRKKIGDTATQLKIMLVDCQLGCF